MSVSQTRQGKTDRSILNIKNRSLFRYLLLSILFVLMSGNVAWGQNTYTLVTSTSDLVAGEKYLIVSAQSGTAYALGYQNTNNRPQATTSVTISSGSFTATPATAIADVAKPYEITLGGSSGAWTLYDPVYTGYLYAASSSSNLLKTAASVANWTISFSSNAAVMTCTTGGYSRNIIRYNTNLFSCYSTGQSAVYLFKKVTSTPTLNVGSLTDFGSQCINNTYGPNSFTINGSNLTTANVTVGALTGYTYSTTSGGTYTSTLSLTQSGGTYSQAIYVKFSPTAVQPYGGNIAVGGGGATSVNVVAAGSGVNTIPTVTASAATSVTSSSATLPGSITVTGCTSISAYGVEYSTTNGFANGAGTQVAGSNLSGSNFSVNLSSLSAGTTYYYKTYATNGAGTSYSAQSSFTTLKNAPTTQASVITFYSVGTASMTVGWTIGNGDGRVVLISTSNSFTNPVNGTPLTGDSSDPIAGQCVYSGTGNSVTVTGLTQGTTYWFRVYEYNNSGSNIVYNTTTATDNPKSQTTLSGPCISEGFGNYNTGTRPTGWTFTGIADGETYTTSPYIGATSPSLKMANTGDAIETASVSNASQLKFWIYGNGTPTTDKLLVQGWNGTSWVDIDNITPPTSSGVTKTYNSTSTPNLISGFSKFKFTYTKVSINLGFDDVEVTCVSGPTITASATSLTGLDYNIGNGPSVAQTFTVSGSSLTNNIVITPPTNFEISTNGTSFGTSAVTLNQSSGTVNATVIYIRLVAGLAMNAYTDNISLTSTGATSKAVSLTGNVVLQAPVATSANPVLSNGFTANWNAVDGATSYVLSVYTKTGAGATDLIISEYVEGTGSEKYIEIFNGTASSIALSNYILKLYANGSSTASDNALSGTLASGSTKVYKNSAATAYSGAATVNAATNFNGDDAIVLYKVSPAGNVDIFGNIGEDPGTAWTSGSYTTLDKTLVRKSSVSAGVTTDPASGFPTLSTEWDVYDIDEIANLGSHTMSGGTNAAISGSPFTITAPTISHTITGLTAGTTYYYTVVAKNGSTTSSSSNEITVELPTGATITATPTVLSGLDYAYGKGPSASVTFTVSGTVLSSNISITAPTHYEISTNGTTFSSSLSLVPSSGNVSATTIYVRLKGGLSIGSYDGESISLSSGTASATVTLNGTVRVGDILVNDVIDGTNWNMFMPLTGTLKVYEKTTGGGYADDLFFSKYLEGQSSNKLLEIYNGTENAISLANYKVKVFQNAGNVAIDWTNTAKVKTYTLSGTLQPGEIKVIYTKETNASNTVCSNFDTSWQEFTTSNPLQFNGNDPIILTKNDVAIDVIGQYSGTTPASGWGDMGTDYNSLRVFLLRNNTVTSGSNAVSSNTTDFTTLTTEWTLKQNIDEGVSGTTTCDAISTFGSYDYNAFYSTWNLISGAVSNTNQVTLPTTSSRKCEELKAEITDGGTTVLTSNTFRVPIMVSVNNATVANISTSLSTEVCADCDVAVLSGGILTASTEGKKFKDAFVLAGGKLDVPNKLEVNDLMLKAGYSGNLYSTFPTSSMKIDATNGVVVNGNFAYVRQIDDTQWYFVSFPYNVKLTDIYALNASLGTYNTDWYIKYWDGQSRAINRTTTGNWKVFAYDVNATLTANNGYIIGLKTGATPKQIVFPMLSNSTIPKDANKTITVTAYVKGDATTDAYSDGWNLIGIPFLSQFNGSGLPAGTKILLSDGGTTKTYTVKYASDFDGTNLLNPFISYYIQVGDALAGTGVAFNTTSRSLAPRKNSQENSMDNVRVFYTSTTGEDYLNLELDETQNVGYEIGRDLVKWFGTGTAKPQVFLTQGGYNLAVDAVNYSNAQNIPVTVYNKTAGSATFRADATSAKGLLSLILSDNVTGANTNLLTTDYTYTADAGTISNRFTLSAQRIITAEKPLPESDIQIISNNGVIRIKNISTETKVELFDTVGRTIAKTNSNNNIAEFSNLSKGVYIIQIITEGKRLSYKIIL